jgi:hypothetical protein
MALDQIKLPKINNQREVGNVSQQLQSKLLPPIRAIDGQQ